MRSKILVGILLLASACLDTETGPTFEGQMAKDVQAIDDYLAAHPGSSTDIIVKDASGIRLVITNLGTGTIPPNPSNNLKVAYSGRLLSTGGTFDSNNSYLLKLSDQVINGWKIGIALLTQGAEAKLYIPSGWGYGANGNGTIPPNANLVFDIHLIDVVPTQAQIDRLNADINTIDTYLSTNSITAQSHSSGIRYVITEPGTGVSPTIYDEVKINFKATLLSDKSVILNDLFEPNAVFSSRVVNYPHGVLVGMQLMNEGGKATFYVPSILVTGLQNVPTNSIVIFEVELLDVLNK
jgi:FKBP-type peptidyl-prolyl cis-trans isomerase